MLVSRGELIEIGDGFRIPDVLARSGARLVEVGTTNRTRATDYEQAAGADTALLLRVHQSNFRVVGFTEQPSAARARRVAKRLGLPLLDDLGSGALVELSRRADRARTRSPRAPTSSASAATSCSAARRRDRRRPRGADRAAATASAAPRAPHRQARTRCARGDAAAVPRPGARTARGSRAADAARGAASTVRARAERLAAAVGGEVEETVGRVGGGASAARGAAVVRLRRARGALAEALRAHEPPVIGILRDGRLLLDCRTLADDERRRSRRRGPRMPLTVGTAGHIDHGKTWLVRALTGKDTDRLPEEQARGISIDLGLRAARPAGRAAALARRRTGPRAFRADDDRRRDRHRPVPARDRRAGGSPARRRSSIWRCCACSASSAASSR